MKGGNVVIVFSYCHFFSSISVPSICVHSTVCAVVELEHLRGRAGPRLATSRASTVCIQTGFNRTILRRRQNKHNDNNDWDMKLNIIDYRVSSRLSVVLTFAKTNQKISIYLVHPHCRCTMAEAACMQSIACRSKLQISSVRDTFHRDM